MLIWHFDETKKKIFCWFSQNHKRILWKSAIEINIWKRNSTVKKIPIRAEFRQNSMHSTRVSISSIVFFSLWNFLSIYLFLWNQQKIWSYAKTSYPSKKWLYRSKLFLWFFGWRILTGGSNYQFCLCMRYWNKSTLKYGNDV